jgi:hypothetical protein
VNDGNISAKLAIVHEEDVPASLRARLTGSSTGLKGREKERSFFEEETPPSCIVWHTISTRLSRWITRSALGVGHIWACSESAVARGMPQKQGTVGAPRGRRGRPRRHRMAAGKLGSGRMSGWAAGRASSLDEAKGLAKLRRLASAICPSGLLLSKLCRSWPKSAWALSKGEVCWEARALLVSASDRPCVSDVQTPGAAVHAAYQMASSAVGPVEGPERGGSVIQGHLGKRGGRETGHAALVPDTPFPSTEPRPTSASSYRGWTAEALMGRSHWPASAAWRAPLPRLGSKPSQQPTHSSSPIPTSRRPCTGHTQPATAKMQQQAQLGRYGRRGCCEVLGDEVWRCPEDAVSS